MEGEGATGKQGEKAKGGEGRPVGLRNSLFGPEVFGRGARCRGRVVKLTKAGCLEDLDDAKASELISEERGQTDR